MLQEFQLQKKTTKKASAPAFAKSLKHIPLELPAALPGALLKISRLSVIFSADLTIQISSNSYYEKSQWHFPNCRTFALPTAKRRSTLADNA